MARLWYLRRVSSSRSLYFFSCTTLVRARALISSRSSFSSSSTARLRLLHLAHVFQELVGQQADVRPVQAGQREDVGHALGDHGVVENLLEHRCSSPPRCASCPTLVALAIAALMAEKKAISLRSAAASSSVPHSEIGLGDRRHHIEEALLAVSSGPSTWLAAGTSSVSGLRLEVAVVEAVQHAAHHVHLLQQHGQRLGGL